MDERTLTALEGSIEKWRKIITGEGVDQGAKNCPLCAEFHPNYRTGAKVAKLFNVGQGYDYCAGCPARERIGLSFCKGTPYREFTQVSVEGRATTPEARKAALDMLDFLCALLPGEAKEPEPVKLRFLAWEGEEQARAADGPGVMFFRVVAGRQLGTVALIACNAAGKRLHCGRVVSLSPDGMDRALGVLTRELAFPAEGEKFGRRVKLVGE